METVKQSSYAVESFWSEIKIVFAETSEICAPVTSTIEEYHKAKGQVNTQYLGVFL
jgi:hypothetical protein